MRAINILLSILVSVIMGLGVLELGARILGFGPPKTINQFNATLGWDKTPGATDTRKTPEFQTEYAINELGLRDDEMASPAKPEGTFRVVVLGDSFTLGYTVDRHNLFVDQLESLWQSEGRQVDVINAGTEAYSTDQEVLWFLEHGAEYEPDLVLILPFENDLYWCGQERYLAKDKPRFNTDGSLEDRELIDNDAQDWKRKFAITRLFGKKHFLDHVYELPNGSKMYGEFVPLLAPHLQKDFSGATLGFVKEAEDRAKGSLIALSQACNKLGAELAMVPIPSRECFDTERHGAKQAQMGLTDSQDWDPRRVAQTYAEMAAATGIRVLDPYADLAEASADEALYYAKDFHLNAAGNRVMAEFLNRELNANGAFPASHAKQKDGAFPTAIAEESGSGIPRWMMFFAGLWVALSALFIGTYPEEPAWQAPFKIFGMLALVFSIVFGANWLTGQLPPALGKIFPIALVALILGFVIFKLGRRLGTIAELFKSFVMRGHWYLMPLVVVLLTIGSLLVVAASSPLVAPFIYTLF